MTVIQVTERRGKDVNGKKIEMRNEEAEATCGDEQHVETSRRCSVDQDGSPEVYFWVDFGANEGEKR